MKKYLILGILGGLILLASCKNYLDQKPDLQKVVPTTLADCQLLLDDYQKMNISYPDHGEVAADNYYMTDAVWNGLASGNPEAFENYIWAPQGQHVSQYANSYAIVYNANLVLQILNKFPPESPNYNTLKGTALFFRAFAFYQAAQLFLKPYTAATAGTDPGLPLRLSPDLDIKSVRGTVQQTYDRIVQDFNDAIALLPLNTTVKSRPNKAAAYGALARTYLAMEDYINAGKMADECLKLYNTLINYNLTNVAPTASTVRETATDASFLRFNDEVIFQATSIAGIMTEDRAIVDQDLYNSYALTDRRRSVFFQNIGDGTDTFIFRGSYDGSITASLFNGVATDEVYLIRAESNARQGNTAVAMTDLNTLMSKRMIPPYVNRTAINADEALVQILTERRKELIYRTLRWTDLKRLNKDPRFATTLRRNKNTMVYTPLAPNDLRYSMLIPLQVINTTGIQQNAR